MKEWLRSIKARPSIAHLLRANERYSGRLGRQFAAAITYFSVLAIVPIIMVAFAVTGFVLVELRPELISQLQEQISAQLGGPASLTDSIDSAIDRALNHYASVGIIGFVSALYAGAGWAGNIKDAIRAQWREHFDQAEPRQGFLPRLGTNLLLFVILVAAVAVTFAIASAATALRNRILDWFHSSGPAVEWLLWLLPIAASIGVGWLVFMLLYRFIPTVSPSGPGLRRGALGAAIGLAVLQYLTGFIFDRFGGNATAAVFGPVIVLMLFFNLFAQLILFVACWITTAEQPAVSWVTEHAPDREPDTDNAGSRSARDAPVLLPRRVAERSVRVGMAAGYLTGAATGVGAGAVLTYVMTMIKGRRRS